VVSEQSGRQAAVEALVLTPPEELLESMAELKAAAEEAGLTGKDIQKLLNARPDLPRPLLPGERDTVVALLCHRDFPCRDQLLAQVDSTYVVGYCGCGCAAVGLTVQGNVAPAACEDLNYWGDTAVVVDEGGELTGMIHLIVRGGYLDEIAITWFEAPICPLPPLDRLRWDE
jgi:hypothetical protein